MSLQFRTTDVQETSERRSDHEKYEFYENTKDFAVFVVFRALRGPNALYSGVAHHFFPNSNILQILLLWLWLSP